MRNFITCTASHYIHRVIESRRMRWAEHVERMGEMRNAYKILFGKPEGKRPRGRIKRRLEDNIKVDLRELEWETVDWIHLAQDRHHWQDLVKAKIYFRVPQNVRSFLI
jgi:hypothetical protein